MRGHPGPTAVFAVAAISQGVLQGFLIWVLRNVLVSLGEATGVSTEQLVVGAFAIFGVWLLRSLATFAGEVAQIRLSTRVEVALMRRVLSRLVRLSVRFFERSSQGDLVMAAYQDVRNARLVTLHVASILLTMSRLLGLAVAAWAISPGLALIGFVAMPLGMLPAHSLGQRITRAARRARASTVTLHDSFLQVASGIRSIKVNRGEQRIVDQARATSEELYRVTVDQGRSRSLARVLLDLISGLGLVVVLVVGGREVGAGTLDWQSLLALLVAMMAVYSPALRLISVFTQIRAFIPSIERMDQIFDAPLDVADRADARRVRTVPETIELRKVTFRYDGGPPALDSVSATFHRGERIGIVGASGSGKSTLIALMLRLFDPTSGAILYGGIDLREMRHADLLDQCALVAQEPFLFIDTIANNIRWGRPDASMDEVVSAAKAALIHDEIMAMPEGYETMLGRGLNARGLSGGQQQRVCIAAALLKNTPLLFLDEATSNLDSVAERTVQKAIDRLMIGRTTFVVAHRMSMLRGVDRILVLERGRMIGLGTHQTLLAECDSYRIAWEHQQGTL